eukprot:753999-Hanusia_phi.AAC.2
MVLDWETSRLMNVTGVAMAARYNQHGIRGGQFTKAKIKHSRDLFKEHEARASLGPGLLYASGTVTERTTKTGAPIGTAGKVHERPLWKREEEVFHA